MLVSKISNVRTVHTLQIYIFIWFSTLQKYIYIFILFIQSFIIYPTVKSINAFGLYTVGENIIATIKMRNNFCYPLKMIIFSAILDFSLLQKLSLLISLLKFLYEFVDWFMASILYCFPYSYRSSNYCDSNSCCYFTLLKALAKSNGNLFAIAFKSEKERQLSLSQ